jgi:hypothetical protein
VERQHCTIRESLVKACDGNIAKWPAIAPHVFWADRATIRKSTGYSPFYMAHGTEPLLPFDLTLATFLVPDLIKPMPTEDLIATQACQLLKRDDDLDRIHDSILKARFASVRQFERQFENTISSYNFKPGNLVLVQNSASESDLGRKTKPRYLGPMVVIRHSRTSCYDFSLYHRISTVFTIGPRSDPFPFPVHHPLHSSDHSPHHLPSHFCTSFISACRRGSLHLL